MQQIIQNFIKDVKLELDDEFDRNFERKAFFDDAWKPTKMHNDRGSLMLRSGALRQSIDSTISNYNIIYTSSLPYASIHNEGGEITVTKKMKSFFWAMYYKTSGAVSGKGSQRDIAMSSEAKQWKNMALMKVGKKIKIEQRQFIGDHPNVGKAVEEVFLDTKVEIRDYLIKEFKK
ncbi:phage virion morphogenesis protein [Brumimicrobium mesophilum]|uniref:hypothetical protein n=1 Tax=Brumimicrobium mesophilum TaxID=392717 RepID=UPI000D142A8A|nr:hypothetical protein [Brumimicrobium mesophilum]